MKHLIYSFVFSLALFASMNLSALCIGCGCFKGFRECVDCRHSACCTEGIVDRNCCKKERKQCNRCIGSLICIRIGFINGEAIIGAGDIYFEWEELDDYPDIKEDILAQIEPYRDLVDKVLNGQELSEEELARIP